MNEIFNRLKRSNQPNLDPSIFQGIQQRQPLLERIKQNVTNPSADNAYKAGMLLFGGKPENTESSKLDEIYAEQAIKDLFKDPVDIELQREYKRAATERALRDPFYMTDEGRKYYEARTGQAQSQGEQAKTETDIMNEVKGQLGSGNGGGNITPGTTVQAGPYNIPLNPKLDADQAAAISSVETFVPQVEKIAEAVKGGVFNSTRPGILGKMERTSRQYGVDTGIPLLTSQDPKLQEVQGYLNSVRRYAFGEGGKALTGTEKDIVYALLNTTGKSDEQIISDHQKAMETIKSKANIALGGRNAVVKGQQPKQTPSFNSPEEADMSGLPKGTRVMVNGRPYEI